MRNANGLMYGVAMQLFPFSCDTESVGGVVNRDLCKSQAYYSPLREYFRDSHSLKSSETKSGGNSIAAIAKGCCISLSCDILPRLLLDLFAQNHHQRSLLSIILSVLVVSNCFEGEHV